AIPYDGMMETVKPLASAVAGKTVISTIVPLEFVRGVAKLAHVAAGSAAQELQELLPEARVVAAFHHLSAPTLADLSQPVDADVLVCGDDAEAKQQTMALAETLPGARGVDAGPLESAFYLEAFTALLLRINRRYKAHAGVRITHLPEPGLSGK
ncbi:MAG TPA: NADPH-dependent F420 reductase, partial [Chloroflexota bacterium]